MSEKKVDGGELLSSLTKKLGFNPTSGRPDSAVLTSALEVVRKKRAEELQGRAVQVIEKAVDVAKKWDSLKKEWKKEEEKMAKELKKLLGSLDGMSRGDSAEVVVEDPTDED